MNSYDLVRKEWIVSPAARVVYRASAVVSLTLFPVLLAIRSYHAVPPFLRTMLFLAILGTALTGGAMECFLFRYDNKSGLKQIFWFCAMLIVPFGAALYCFLVYSGSELHKRASVESLNIPRSIS